MCDILRANFLNNQEAIMCDKEVLMSHATKMLHVSLQRAEAVFPALKKISVTTINGIYGGGLSRLTSKTAEENRNDWKQSCTRPN